MHIRFVPERKMNPTRPLAFTRFPLSCCSILTTTPGRECMTVHRTEAIRWARFISLSKWPVRSPKHECIQCRQGAQVRSWDWSDRFCIIFQMFFKNIPQFDPLGFRVRSSNPYVVISTSMRIVCLTRLLLHLMFCENLIDLAPPPLAKGMDFFLWDRIGPKHSERGGRLNTDRIVIINPIVLDKFTEIEEFSFFKSQLVQILFHSTRLLNREL